MKNTIDTLIKVTFPNLTSGNGGRLGLFAILVSFGLMAVVAFGPDMTRWALQNQIDYFSPETPHARLAQVEPFDRPASKSVTEEPPFNPMRIAVPENANGWQVALSNDLSAPTPFDLSEVNEHGPNNAGAKAATEAPISPFHNALAPHQLARIPSLPDDLSIPDLSLASLKFPALPNAVVPDEITTASATTVRPELVLPRPQPRPDAASALRLATFIPPSTRPAARPASLTYTLARAEPSAAPDLSSAPGIIAGIHGCSRQLTNAIPSRKNSAPTGSNVFAGLMNASGGTRDKAVISELARGNMPSFLRNLQPVVFRGKDATGKAAEIIICVTPDYLAVGSERDFVRAPLGLPAAAQIARRFNMTLPTPKMVDAIYAQSKVRLSPRPMEPGAKMATTAYLLRHNKTIEAQRGGRNGLISGHKKDVVMTNRMASAPGRVAIYGWHRSSGRPIQPVSTVHGASYADYSHGVRLVSKTAFLNGRAIKLDDLLTSPRYAKLINKDGPMPGSVVRIASR